MRYISPGRLKPSRERVVNVSGLFSFPVKTRLPSAMSDSRSDQKKGGIMPLNSFKRLQDIIRKALLIPVAHQAGDTQKPIIIPAAAYGSAHRQASGYGARHHAEKHIFRKGCPEPLPLSSPIHKGRQAPIYRALSTQPETGRRR